MTVDASPDRPSLWVAAVVVEEDRLLLVWRPSAPDAERWSLPSVEVALGEPLAAAVVRAVEEDAGLEAVCEGRLGHIEQLREGHRVLLTFRATVLADRMLRPATRWVDLDEVAEQQLADGLAELLADQGILRVIA